MKVLLVNPPSSPIEIYNEVTKGMAWSIPPLGLAYIAAVLEKNDIEVKIYDGQIQKEGGFKELNRLLMEMKPDVIGLTSTTPTFHNAVETAKNIKQLTDTPIVIGGAHVSALPLKTLEEHPELDIVAVGEGENIMLNVVRAIEGEKPLSEVDGIAYRNSSKIAINKPAAHIENLDELPFPARHLLPDLKQYNYVNFKRLPTTHMLTSRGCPFSCIFCDHPFGKRVRLHSVDYVIREIEYLVSHYHVKDIHFHDENLMFDQRRLMQICDKIIEKGIDITWTCQARADKADLELFKKMKKAGCWMLSFGIESGNQEVLNFIKKGIRLETVRAAVRCSKKAGLETRGSFMIGHPIDTKETIKQTVDFAKSLNLDYAGFAITVPYPGSELYNIAHKYGTFKKQDFSKFKRADDEELSFVPFGFTEKELIALNKKARIDFHFKSAYPFRALKNIKNLSRLKRYLVGSYNILLGDFFKIKKKKVG